MPTCITHGIKISVSPRYEPEHSSTVEQRYVFSYKIIITNESEDTVQLLRRHWMIYDSNANKREVQGDGVIGEQPIIYPGASHEYISWCPFNSEIGMMKGYFAMQRDIDDHVMHVIVPKFTMVASPRLN